MPQKDDEVLGVEIDAFQSIKWMTNHTEEACDRYIKAYKKVEKLSTTMNIDEIAQVLEMSRSLVEEYINILNEEED